MASWSKGESVAGLGNDCTGIFHELVNTHDTSQQKRQQWQRQRDNSLGPILSNEWVVSVKGKEKGGEGISQRERDCLRLKRADEEWIGEARKVVSAQALQP